MKNTIIFVAASALWLSASAGNVQIQVLDRDGKPVPEAVVVVYPGGAAGATGTPPSLLQANPTIEQERMRFVPAVTVVEPGATVRFTNQDRWDHHVRGAAAGLAAAAGTANTGFELRLAGKADGKPANSAEVKLDTPGVVLLSCHLHGSMRGHVFVTDSGWTLKTDADGIARFPGVPDGPAQVRVWHAEQLIDLPRKALNVVPGPVLDTVQLSVVPRVRRAPPAGPAPSGTPGGPMGGYSQGPAAGAGERVAHRH
ncbi:plastocyanin/azurin family copper-binding protein [Acidovorax sp.]|uniref:plastocyanin/azurin family copper-binding protein n=1 Tax=Acidovorax sp. TaxID=1872122 RepID=UPI00344520F7